MRFYIDFNHEGNVEGFYVDEIHGDNIPETAISISEGEWQVYSAAAHLYRFDGEIIREKTQEELEAAEAALLPVPKSPEQQRIEHLEAAVESLILDALGGGSSV